MGLQLNTVKMAVVHEMCFGLNKGHKTTKNAQPKKHSYRRGTLSKRTAVVRQIVREVSGFAPYKEMHGIVEDRKGQACPPFLQKEARMPRSCPEEARRNASRHPVHEEGSRQGKAGSLNFFIVFNKN